jgi:type I restriction enzyme S subunit
MTVVPENWTASDIGSVADIYQPETISKSKLVPDGQFTVFGANGPIGKYDRYNHDDPELLITCRGATCGSVNISEPQSWINGNAMVVRPDERVITKGFAEKFFRGACDYAKVISGSAQPQITRQSLSPTVIPIPPLPEQRRIVAKLDRLSARSAAARDHLAHTTKLATRAKQAILSAAFRGELLGLKPVDTPKFNGRCWDLPTGWKWARFEEVATIRSNLNPPSEMTDLPHVAPDNIEAGTGRLLPYRTIGEDGVKSGKHKFFAGQIIYSKIRPYLRKAVIVDFDGACSADMYPVDCGPEIDIQLLHRWMISEDFAWFTAEHEGRSVLPKINQKGLNSAPVPVIPADQQAEIVRRIESAFARIDRLTEEASRAAHLLDRLDERLLAKAFRGELVPQDPDDEPAEALLTRIREARAAAPKPTRGRKKKASV